jgi:hypothetical protein
MGEGEKILDAMTRGGKPSIGVSTKNLELGT